LLFLYILALVFLFCYCQSSSFSTLVQTYIVKTCAFVSRKVLYTNPVKTMDYNLELHPRAGIHAYPELLLDLVRLALDLFL
jgi:hypothetical protein